MRLALLACFAAAAACGKGDSSDTPKKGGRGGGGGRKLEYPVDVATLETRHLQYAVTAPGSIEAFQQVQITARVGGAVDKVAFTEGQVVNKGDVLAVIESERYQIAVDQANASAAKAAATQKAAEMALQRRQKAQDLSPGLVPGEEIEQKQAAFDTAKADVSAAKEQQHIAQLNLRDSQVRAPIAGVVQTRTVQQGQYLAAGYVLATILQREPLLVRFQVSEQDAPRLKSGQTANVTLKESRDTFTAKLTLVADAADPTTRMVPVTAQLDPTDHKHWLRPGAFCQVAVPVDDARDGIVVPSLAVQPTEKGNIVYVYDKDKGVVHATIVQLGMHTSQGEVEIRGATADSIKPGMQMVVHGIEPLTDGAPVKISSSMTLEQAAVPVDAGVPLQAPTVPASEPSGSGGGSGSGGSGSGGHRHRGSGSGSAAP